MGIGELSHYVASDRPQARSSTRAQSLLYSALKRSVDILVSGLALVLLAPVLLIIAIAIRLDSPGAVIFVQKRVRGDQSPAVPHPERNVFAFLKFRSMQINNDHGIHRSYVTEYINGHTQVNNGSRAKPLYKMRNDPRVTRVGRVLRRSSLDELPQLVNVLKGEMTLVGPRPALPYEVEQYSPDHKRRLIPRGGLTGLWQVSGRTTLSFQQMVQLDIEYAQRRSLWLDIKILLRTIPAILSRDGAW